MQFCSHVGRLIAAICVAGLFVFEVSPGHCLVQWMLCLSACAYVSCTTMSSRAASAVATRGTPSRQAARARARAQWSDRPPPTPPAAHPHGGAALHGPRRALLVRLRFAFVCLAAGARGPALRRAVRLAYTHARGQNLNVWDQDQDLSIMHPVQMQPHLRHRRVDLPTRCDART